MLSLHGHLLKISEKFVDLLEADSANLPEVDILTEYPWTDGAMKKKESERLCQNIYPASSRYSKPCSSVKFRVCAGLLLTGDGRSRTFDRCVWQNF